MQVNDQNTGNILDLTAPAVTILKDAGIDSPTLEVQLIMAHVLKVNRLHVITHPEHLLSAEDAVEFLRLINLRKERHPLAYIIGRREFFGMDFIIKPGVLVPRPETEILVEKCINTFKHKACVLADIGCGSGAIATALAANLPNSHIYATDISDTALEVSAENAAKFNLNNKITFLKGNLIEPIKNLDIKFDSIVSNPPYIPSEEISKLEPEVSEYEPREALDGGTDGLDIYRRLIPDAFELLKDDGMIAVEVGIGEAKDVREIALNAGYKAVEIINDLAGIERIVVAFK